MTPEGALGDRSLHATPFAPPRAEVGRVDWAWLAILVTWGSAGAFVAVAVAVARASPGTWGWIGGAVAGGAALGAASGLAAFAAERRAAAPGPELIDRWGEGSHPVHGWLYAVPAWATCAAALVLASLAGQRDGAAGSVLGALGVAAVRTTRRHRLARALLALDAGDARAVAVLRRLGGPWSLRDPFRATARVNLGMYALSRGESAEALSWCEGGATGAAVPWADVTTALARLARGDDPALAAHALNDALRAPEGRAVQSHADAVRILLLWRTEGEPAALGFAERVFGPRATYLHRALLATLLARAGREAGELWTEEVVAFRAGPLGRIIPELQ